PPTDATRLLAWVERRMAEPRRAGAALLPGGLPPDWVGSNFEVYGVPTSASSTVAFAIRWHGERPAVLWEQSGDTVALSSPLLATEWSSDEVKGETLWPAPPGVLPATPTLPDDGVSFS
ncbi:MAG: hypothetical protein WCI22_11545, partial [Actinomycetota bacterium]